MNHLAVSAEFTGTYLGIHVEYGDDTTLHPERINDLLVKVQNKQNIVLREFKVSANYSNSSGTFEMGTVLTNDEKAYIVGVLADTKDGRYNAHCEITIAANTITGNMF